MAAYVEVFCLDRRGVYQNWDIGISDAGAKRNDL